MWFSICSRRTVIECVGLSLFALFHGFFEDVMIFPELLCLLFPVNEVHICFNFVIHIILLNLNKALIL